MTTEGTCPEVRLSAHDLMVDPYGGFGRVREETPIARSSWDGAPVWIITRHEHVTEVLTDRRFSTTSAALPGGADVYAEVLHAMGISPELAPHLVGDLVRTGPPDHTRLRKIVLRAFSARRVAALRPRMRALTGALLDTLPDHARGGSVDLIEHFAQPLPTMVICELIGIPAADMPRWHGWSRDYTSADPRRLNRMLAEVDEHVRELAARRRAEPADDLIGELVRARADERLSERELVTMVLTLMMASQQPTPHLIGNAVLALLTHPGQLALLRADRSLLPGAVQELLRWCGPSVVALMRYATEDVTVAGTPIRRGDRVQLVLGSANHDPRRFPHPERLDLTRPPDTGGTAHLAYSRGEHYCLGATLASQEAEVALGALLDRHPGLALAVPPDEVEWKPLALTRQLARLPVTLGEPAR
ncbi:cytochrome P450 family protein [Actinomadura roseirufa]|uniref:cytochrome P450 family protein n=1 Tax=Actinomadura roseirufa TaxID=2094049 RepID=UPI0010416D5A|nr:cytochrome P450 [Actinomadura roseirufa]